MIAFDGTKRTHKELAMPILSRVLMLEFVMGCLLFAAAGRIDLPWFWAILAIHTIVMLIGILNFDPGLCEERMHPGPGVPDGNVRFVSIPLIFAHLIVAGLDVGRFGWSGSIDDRIQGTALFLYGVGLTLSVWSVSVNRFFSPVIRIQSERGHHVVSTGPYRFVRHPGYLGLLIASISGGIALGSWWSLVPLLPVVVLFVRRTAIEDRTLRAGLDGYEAYASHVRRRLLPGLW
jgi:protein-S-isoprenylcysteine O-methyltransferase Ste14